MNILYYLQEKENPDKDTIKRERANRLLYHLKLQLELEEQLIPRSDWTTLQFK